MQKAVLSIIYHCSDGQATQVARIIEKGIRSELTKVNMIKVEDAEQKLALLHCSDTIIFGCPTLFGNVTAPFKQFMELTELFVYKQLWKDKLAGAFTISSTCNGDKLQTLISMALFAAQHSMIWISLGILPRFINGQQTDGQNRLASYIGLTSQGNLQSKINQLHTGDILTAELFAKRILEITVKFQSIQNQQDTPEN